MKNKKRESILWIEGGGFSFLILCVWLGEWLQVPHYVFAEPSGGGWMRPVARTLILLGVWLAVHLATRRLLRRLHHLEEYLRICAWCRKIGHDGAWMTTEEYFGSTFTTKTTHGMCPECSRKMAAETPPIRVERQ